MRLGHRNCYNACEDNSDTAVSRLYSYIYVEGQPSGEGSGTPGHWDTDDYGQWGSCSNTTGFYCGQNANEGLETGRWYLIEFHVKMNTPGIADGAMEGWIDGTLRYRKTNVLFRTDPHDDLTVRTFFFSQHWGGEFQGPCTATYALYDQIVLSTDGPIGGLNGDATEPPEPPGALRPD
jgi:hypothetical protein